MRRTLIDTILAMVVGALLYFSIIGQLRAQVSTAEKDPTGFTDLLNAERMRRGLAAVSYNPNYVMVAAQNNAWQAVRGLGHHVIGGLAQCSGVGQSDAQSVLAAWLSSPGHAAILLDPSLVSVGYHQQGSCHTVSCSSSGSTYQYDYNFNYYRRRRLRW